MKLAQNINSICNYYSYDDRVDFQNNFFLENINHIANSIKKGDNVYLKAIFSEEQEKFYHPEHSEPFYVNMFSDNYIGKAEPMWLKCKDIDIDCKSICGLLSDKPLILNSINHSDVVIVNFKDIEDIIVDIQQLS